MVTGYSIVKITVYWLMVTEFGSLGIRVVILFYQELVIL